MAENDRREALAEYAHEAWAGWMNYLLSKSIVNDDGSWTIPPELAERWYRQLTTPYFLLPEGEKESDRAEADKMLALAGSDKHAQQESVRCRHEGCTNDGLDCYLPDNDSGEPDEWYCIDHIHQHGYCFGCRQFWGGVENFEFARDGLCENCRYSGDFDEDDYDSDLDFGFEVDPYRPDSDTDDDYYPHSNVTIKDIESHE